MADRLKAWDLARFLDRNMGDSVISVETDSGRVNITDVRFSDGKIVLTLEVTIDVPNIILEPVHDGPNVDIKAALREARKEKKVATLNEKLDDALKQAVQLRNRLANILTEEVSAAIAIETKIFAKAFAGEEDLNSSLSGSLSDISNAYLLVEDVVDKLEKAVNQ